MPSRERSESLPRFRAEEPSPAVARVQIPARLRVHPDWQESRAGSVSKLSLSLTLDLNKRIIRVCRFCRLVQESLGIRVAIGAEKCGSHHRCEPANRIKAVVNR